DSCSIGLTRSPLTLRAFRYASRSALAAQSRPRTEPSLREDRLEQFYRIAGGVVDQALLAADTSDDVGTKVNASFVQRLDHTGHIGDLDRETIPPPWFGQFAVGHGLPAARSATRLGEDET